MKSWGSAGILVVVLAVAAAAADAGSPAPKDPVAAALNELAGSLAALDKPEAAAADQAVVEGDSSKPAAVKRSPKESAAIVSTAAAIGSAVGAIAMKENRGRGAAIGAAVGGVAGLIYDRMTANRKPDDTPPAAVAAGEKKAL